MKILFHTNTLNYRGTTVALTDYAKCNQEILGNESVIAYNASLGYEKDVGSEQTVVDELKKRFNVIGYNEGDLEDVISKEQVETAYFIRAGQKEFLPTNCKTAVHAVFQYNEPHGDRYAYVSKWLSDSMSDGKIPYVPHIVTLPQPTADYRKALNISSEQTVIGRIGGYYTFDIHWVKYLVNKLASNKDLVFLFVGTEPFIDHPNIKFINEIHDLQKKANFINTCDVMLHARQRGESFGLAVAEFLYLNKPVLAWNNGHDKNHMEMLKGSGLLYNSPQELESMLLNAKSLKGDWTRLVQDYNPTSVMEKFNKVFLL